MTPRHQCHIGRFLMKVTMPQDGSCWEWIGARISSGYGRFRGFDLDGRARQDGAHRFSYETFVGRIPSGLDLDHLCRNPSCVNPAHLEPVTRSVNVRRGMEARGRATHCKRGHEFTPENTRVSSSGGRTCRACARMRMARLRERVRASRPRREPYRPQPIYPTHGDCVQCGKHYRKDPRYRGRQTCCSVLCSSRLATATRLAKNWGACG